MRRAKLLPLALVVAASCATAIPPKVEPGAPPPQAVPDPRVDRLETAVRELTDRIDVINARLASIEDSVDRLSKAMADQTVVSPQTPDPSPAFEDSPSTAEVSAPPEPPSMSPQDVALMYQEALVLQSHEQWDDALATFTRVYEAAPRGDLADNALFWTGEIAFARGELKKAVAILSRVVEEYPEQGKAPDALLRMGECWTRLGDLALARDTFERLISRYPYSTSASAAREQLRKIRY